MGDNTARVHCGPFIKEVREEDWLALSGQLLAAVGSGVYACVGVEGCKGDGWEM